MIKLYSMIIKQFFKISNPLFKYSYLLMSIVSNKLKVLNAVIIFDTILMMDYLPRMKTSPQMFSHDKTMLTNITSLSNHRIEEIIRENFNFNIAQSSCSTTFPKMVAFTSTASIFITAIATKQIYRFILRKMNPSFLATVRARSPYISTHIFNTYVSTNSGVSYIRHIGIIAHQWKIHNELTL